MTLRAACAVRVPLVVATLCTACAAAAAPRAHVEMSLDLDPETRRFSAVARFEAVQRELRLRLHRALTVRSLTVDGKPVAVSAASGSRDHGVWLLPLARGAKVELAYDGTLPRLDPGMDHRGVLRINAPMASPEGSFLPSGSAWHPQPYESFTYRVTLTLPASQRGLVAGDLVEEQLPAAGTPYRAVFEMKHPTDGIDLMAGPYVVEERTVERAGSPPLRLRTYFTAPLRELAAGYLDDSARYIALYSGSIGAYPYASFSVVASPLPTGFGMPTLTYMGAQVLKLPFIRASSLGHEVLHNWWGNGVYPDYATGNWSEGLTTFMADYAYKERESAQAARDMRLGWMRDIAAVPAEARIPLARFRSRTHGAEAAAGYGKAAMVFFMLRDLIGEEAHARGIRAFWDEHRFRSASWRDLQVAFERASGRSLQLFFDQWLNRADAPQAAISAARAERTAAGYRVTLDVTQREPAYALRLPVEVTAGGRTETRIVHVDEPRERVHFEVQAPPEKVRLDPDVRVWRELRADELPPILRLWIVARTPRYAVATPDPRVQDIATRLARRLFEAPPERPSDAAAVAQANGPVLLVGLHADIDTLLARLKLPPRPAPLDTPATAYAWTVPGLPAGRAPVAVISAQDADALEALLRPLPHYGAQSYLAFQGGRAVTRGVWPVAIPAVPVESR